MPEHTFPTDGWCPSHGGLNHACCALWAQHQDTAPVGVRHVHQATQDTEACRAACPVCRPGSVPLGQQAGQTTASIAYAVLQGVVDRKRQAQAVRQQDSSERAVKAADRKDRQGKLL